MTSHSSMTSPMNTNPNVLTSFENPPGGSPDSAAGGFLRSFLDFVRPATTSNGGPIVETAASVVTPVPLPSSSTTAVAPVLRDAVTSPAPLTRVSSFGQLLSKRNGPPPITQTTSTTTTVDGGADPIGNYRKYWMPDDQCKLPIVTSRVSGMLRLWDPLYDLQEAPSLSAVRPDILL
eukprot:sb/3471862/